MKDSVTIINVAIWEMNPEHPDTTGKYTLAIEIKNVGAVMFGPSFDKKVDAQKFLSDCKERLFFGYADGFALAHLIANKIELQKRSASEID